LTIATTFDWKFFLTVNNIKVLREFKNLAEIGENMEYASLA